MQDGNGEGKRRETQNEQSKSCALLTQARNEGVVLLLSADTKSVELQRQRAICPDILVAFSVFPMWENGTASLLLHSLNQLHINGRKLAMNAFDVAYFQRSTAIYGRQKREKQVKAEARKRAGSACAVLVEVDDPILKGLLWIKESQQSFC